MRTRPREHSDRSRRADQRERGRRPAARPKAQRRPQLRRRLRRARLPCRAQRRAGHSTAGAATCAPANAGRRRGRSPPPSARATAPRRPSAPARPLFYRRTGVHADPATAGAGARRASLPIATPGRGSRRRDSFAGATCAAGALGALSAEWKINNQRPDPVRPTDPPLSRRSPPGEGGSDTRTKTQTACQLCWRDVCRWGVGSVVCRAENQQSAA